MPGGSSRQVTLFWGVLVSLWLAGCASYHPDPEVDDPEFKGRYEIPYESLSEKQRNKVRRVMENFTVQVPLPLTRVASRPAIYDFLLEELPFTAGVVRELRETKYEVYRDDVPPGKSAEEQEAWRHTYYMDDRAGLNLKVELVLAEKNRRIFYTYGSYDLAPLPKVWGRSIIITVWSQKGGLLETEARVYARVESDFYRALSEVFKGTVANAIREKSTIFIHAAKRVTELAAENPSKLYSEMKGSREVDPKVLEDFKSRFLDTPRR